MIGASIPLTGALAAFGQQEKIGDTLAVNLINSKGGIKIGGTMHKVKVKFLDNQSQPNLVTTQAHTLALQDHVVGFFGTTAPPLVIPLSLAADQLHIPFVHHTPIEAWLSGSKTGYTYSWDAFFYEPQQTTTQFLATNEIKTNKKVALFTDTDPDGITEAKLWAKNAPKYGYKVVARESFPEGTTDFSSYVQNAMNAGAQVVIAQMVPPDAEALWKQMKADKWAPKAAYCEKCSYQADWGSSLGSLANGTMVSDVWSAAFKWPDYKLIVAASKKAFGGKVNPGASTVAGSMTCALILLDGIQKAGSTSGPAINAAIAKTNGMFPVGHIKFNAKHYDALKTFQTQWRNGNTVIVWPKVKGGSSVQSPVSGLK